VFIIDPISFDWDFIEYNSFGEMPRKFYQAAIATGSRTGGKSKSRQKQLTSDRVDLIRLVEVNDNLETTDAMRLPILPNQVFSDILSLESTNVISSSTTLSTFGSQMFRGTDFSQFADYSPVFDQYRIIAVEATFRPTANSVTQSTASPGELTVVIDQDDVNVPTSISQLQQYGNAITKPGYKKIRRCFKPHVAMAAYSGAFTSFANAKDQWIDMSSSTVQHYGLKFGWSVASQVYSYDVIVRAHFQFKSTR